MKAYLFREVYPCESWDSSVPFERRGRRIVSVRWVGGEELGTDDLPAVVEVTYLVDEHAEQGVVEPR